MSGVHLGYEGAAALVTFDRPEAKNAIDRAAIRALEQIVGQLEARADLGAVILTGAGDHFVAGGDLKDFTALTTAADGHAMSRSVQAILARLEALPCPTIAAIDGDAHGGGCEIALACDLVVIAPGARLFFKQAAMGLTPGWGGGQRLARRIGQSRALLLLSTAATVGAQEALALGLADRVATGSALTAARELAGAVAALPRLAIRNIKRALREGADRPLPDAISREGELFAQTWGSPDHQAAVARFLTRGPGGTPSAG